MISVMLLINVGVDLKGVVFLQRVERRVWFGCVTQSVMFRESREVSS